MRKLALLLFVVGLAIPSWSQTQTKPEILVLGTYHMANPGRDIFNMQADDVLAPKRQQEIAQVIEVLKNFNPTKIAIESDVTSEKAPKQYSDYLAGKYTLSRNEIDQLGYRLAKELGHKTVYPVDVEGEFPAQRVFNWAKANNQSAKFDALYAQIGKQVKEQNDYMHSHTVLEMLEYMNSDEMARRGVAGYFAYVPFSEPYEWAGPELIAAWYKRNIRIYSNIVRLIDSPTDRILVIYGAGHLGWLQQDVENDASVKLRKLSEFAPKK